MDRPPKVLVVAEHSYSMVDDVVAPDDTQSPGHHVVDYVLQMLLSQGWQKYVATIREGIPDVPAPAVKEITTSFVAECLGGDLLQRGVRAVSRTRRSYVLEEALWQRESGQIVATSRAVIIGIDRTTGRAAEIPAPMWEVVELLEGRSIPVSERPPASH